MDAEPIFSPDATLEDAEVEAPAPPPPPHLQQVRAFQARIKEGMEDMCMSRAELSRLLGISAGRVTQILDVQTNLTTSLCYRLAEAVQCKIAFKVTPRRRRR